jgi:hypothetical protein
MIKMRAFQTLSSLVTSPPRLTPLALATAPLDHLVDERETLGRSAVRCSVCAIEGRVPVGVAICALRYEAIVAHASTGSA